MSSTTYNGYINRETWLTSLWLCSDQGNYELLMSVIRLNKPVEYKANRLKSLVEEEMYDLELRASLFSDLLSTSLSQVDWLEVIKANLD